MMDKYSLNRKQIDGSKGTTINDLGVGLEEIKNFGGPSPGKKLILRGTLQEKK